MTYDEIIQQVAEEYGLDSDITNRIYKSYWKAVREYISSLPMKDDLSQEEFLRLRPNVNIPSIGKLYVTPQRYERIKKAHEIIINNTNAAH